MHDKDDNVESKLRALRESYADQLPAKLEALDLHWQSLCHHWDWETTSLLHRAIHNLAGSSGSFGFHQLGNQARDIEIELKEWINAQQHPDSTQQQNLGQKLAALHETAKISLP